LALEHPTLYGGVIECTERHQQLVLETQIDHRPSPRHLPHVIELSPGDRQGSRVHGCGQETFDPFVIDGEQQLFPRLLPEGSCREMW
jgi:hypothetical protein